MFLESQHIIDYSLLLGVHFRAPDHMRTISGPKETVLHQANPLTENGTSSLDELTNHSKGLRLVTHDPSYLSTVPGPHIRGSTLRAATAGNEEVDLLLPGIGRLRIQLGVNMPAQAKRNLLLEEEETTENSRVEVYDVVLYLGIIDILQGYNLKKKIENSYKSLRYDPLTISAVEPSLYSKRFINFLEGVFLIET